MRTSSTSLLAALAALAALPATGHAVDRHVSPAGGGVACSQASPCSLGYALGGGSVPGDTVLLAPGTYPAGAGFSFAKQLTVRGADLTVPPPVLSSVQNAPTLAATGAAAGSVIRHLDVRSTSAGLAATALKADVPVTVRDTHVRGITQALAVLGGGGTLLENVAASRTAGGGFLPAVRADGPGVTVRDLEVVTPSDDIAPAVLLGMGPADTAEDLDVSGGGGVTVAGGTLRRARIRSTAGVGLGGGQDALVTDTSVLASGGDAVLATFGTLRLRNVTAVSTSPTGHGLRAIAQPNIPVENTVDGTNVIARGPAADVRADAKPDPCFIENQCGDGRVTLAHSAVVDIVGGALVTTGAGMTTADPAFVAADDLHLSPGSPLRDKGVAGAGDGPTDIDGQPRAMGAAPDIGADELAPVPVVVPDAPAPVPPAPAPAPGPGQVSAPGPGPGTTPADTTRPVVTLLRRTRRGLSFRVSENARVRVTVAARRAGKRRAGRCVVPARAPRRAARCPRLVTVGAITRSATTGANAVAMARRVGRRTLRPGRYTATVVATDAAGNRSVARRVTFTVRAPSRRR